MKKAQRNEMPKKFENILKYTNHHKQIRVPFVKHADFETNQLVEKVFQTLFVRFMIKFNAVFIMALSEMMG